MLNPEEDNLEDKPIGCKIGSMHKKDVFVWSVPSSYFMYLETDSSLRSEFFTFPPAQNSKFCLILECDTCNPEGFDFYVCLFRIPSAAGKIIDREVSIKISFSWLVDGIPDVYEKCERTMRECDRVYVSFSRHLIHDRLSVFNYEANVLIQCTLDLEEIVSDEGRSTVGTADGVAFPEVRLKQSDLACDLLNLLVSEKHTDIILSVDESDFRAHKAILAARSPTFSVMFEQNTSGNDRVQVEDIPKEAMPLLLRYLYTGDQPELALQTSLSLFVVADKYAVPQLKRICSRYLCANLSSELVLNVLTVLSHHEDEDLKEAATRVVSDNAFKVMKTKEWLEFLKNHTELANSVMLRCLSLRN